MSYISVEHIALCDSNEEFLRNILTHFDCPTKLFDDDDEFRVFLTVSSLASVNLDGQSVERQLELNWESSDAIPEDWVGLFDHDPSGDVSNPLIQVSAVNYPGYYLTTYEVGRPDVTDFENLPECLGYWIGYFREEKPIVINCLKDQTMWMQKYKKVIENIPLRSLMIPGTHNSGSYRKYRGILSENLLERFLVSQDEDIMHQLVYGIRYLDLRVGYFPGSYEPFWMTHNYYRMQPLSAMVKALRNFLSRTQEIIILDFHRHPIGFQGRPYRHKQLASYLSSELGVWAAPPSLGPDVSPKDLWQINRTLIIAYADTSTVEDHPNLLWDRIPQSWGDKQDGKELRRFLEEEMKRRRQWDYFWAAMAEMTPSALDVVLRPTEGLRIMAERINRNVTNWFRHLWWQGANVVAVDFFRSTDLIDVAVQANVKRRQCLDGVQTFHNGDS